MAGLQNFAGWFGLVAAIAAAIAFGADGFSSWEIAAIVVMVVGAIAGIFVVHPRLVLMVFTGSEVCRLERAQDRDVEAIHMIAVRQFGPNVTPKPQMRALMKRNRDIFWILISPRRGGLSMSVDGYICLLPICEALATKIEADEFDITRVHPEQVPRPQDEIHAIYVGAVVGRTLRAKGQVLGHLMEKSTSLAEKTTSKTVYARAASKDGLRLITQNDFEPIRTDRTNVGALFRRRFDEGTLLAA